MSIPKTISQFLITLNQGWTDWNTLIDSIDRENMPKPGAAGEWSLKDVIAHITWHEREMVGLVEAHALVGSELWNLPTDERNAAIQKQVKELPLEQVLEEAEAVHQQLLELLPTFSDEDLVKAANFPNMPPDWLPGDILAQNTYEHYEQHRADVERWVEELRSEGK